MKGREGLGPPRGRDRDGGEAMEFEKRYTMDRRGIPLLLLECAKDFYCDRPMQILAEIPISELCEAAGRDFAEAIAGKGISAADLSRTSGRLVLANGWQSWSFAGELGPRERPRRAVLKKALNLFADHPAEREIRALAGRGARKSDIVSHFFVVLRLGDFRLALVSDNAGAPPADADTGGSEGRCLPPVTFFVGSSRLRVAVYAEGGSFRAGETIARLAVLAAPDYFALKDRLGILFGAQNRFAGQSFLAGEGSPPAADGPSPSRPRPIGGFETWYNHYLDINETVVSRDLEAIGSNANLANEMFLKRGKPLVFQIDDGWERKVGDWRPDEGKFPRGLASLAAAIEDRGLIPGLWIAPFLLMPDSPVALEHPEWILRGEDGDPILAGWNPGWGGKVFCLDLSLEAVEAYILGLFETIVNVWGFRYLKLDFLYAGMLGGARGYPVGEGAGISGGLRISGGAGIPGGARAPGGRWEHYARLLRRITSMRTTSRGLPVAFLSCGAPFESTAPFMPLARVGADTREHWEWPILRLIGHQARPSAKVNLSHSLARSLLDGTVFIGDPDVVFCRTSNTTLTDNEKFLIGLVARMFASQIMISDAPSEFGGGEEAGGKGGDGARKTLSEAAFTAELLSLYDAIGNREFGVERRSPSIPGLYDFFSRDGKIYGVINLSERTKALEVGTPEGDSKPAVVPPRSILLFGLRR